MSGEGALDAEVEGVLARCSRSFHLASRFLPRACREDTALLYAFCRLVDDVADEPEEGARDERAVLQALDLLDAEVAGAMPARPLVAAFRAMAARRGIDLAHARELIRGVRTDVGPLIVASDRGLVRYSYRVAGTVGLMMCPLLGVRDHAALPFALDLGIAMQLTNICRDVGEDAARGRVYLPRRRLEQVGVRPESLLAGRGVDRRALALVVCEVLALAERYYRSAQAGLRFIPLATRVAILVAARVYRAIGVKVLSRDADVLSGRTVVGPIGKLRAAAGALFRLLDPRLWGLVRRPHDASLHRHLDGLPGADAPPSGLGAELQNGLRKSPAGGLAARSTGRFSGGPAHGRAGCADPANELA